MTHASTRARRAQPIFAAALAAASLLCGAGRAAKAQTDTDPAVAAPAGETAGEAALVHAGPSLERMSIDPPAPPGSTSPALAAEDPTAVSKEHEILITWLEPGEAGGRLEFARLSQETWSHPVTVAERVSTLGPADGPSLTVIDTPAVRRTLIARTGNVVAQSGDGGRTWIRLPAPALPFASFAGGEEGAYAFWLAADRDGPAKLLGTRLLAGETLLDPRGSGGSATSAAMTWNGPIVVYRAQSADGARDVAMVRRLDGKWTTPRLVHADGWRPAERPTSGPHVAAQRRQVAVGWYTEAPDRPRVLVAFSSDAGGAFGAPVEVDVAEGDHAPSGPVAVALDDDGHALVLWLATAGPNEAILSLARVSPDGKRGEELVVAKGPPSRLGGISQVVRAGDRVAVAWVEGVLRRVRAVAIPLAGIPAPADRRPRPVVASGRTPSEQGSTREPAPDLKLVSLGGDEVSLASLRGRAVLLNIWATWCVPCIQEIPELAALHERHGKDGLVVVGVNVDSADMSSNVRAFVAERKIPFAVWLDPEMRVPRAFRVDGLPATLVIDRGGRLVSRLERPIAADDPEITQAVSRALSDS